MTSNQTGAVLANVAGVVTISGSEIVGETLTAGLADDNGVSMQLYIVGRLMVWLLMARLKQHLF